MLRCVGKLLSTTIWGVVPRHPMHIFIPIFARHTECVPGTANRLSFRIFPLDSARTCHTRTVPQSHANDPPGSPLSRFAAPTSPPHLTRHRWLTAPERDTALNRRHVQTRVTAGKMKGAAEAGKTPLPLRLHLRARRRARTGRVP